MLIGKSSCLLIRSKMLVLVLCALFSPSVATAGELPDFSGYNVLLITVDCLRPDHMGIYGYSRDTTPNIDRFFKSAARFDRAFSQSAWTSPGILSLLTGLYPAVHGMDAKGKYFDPQISTPLQTLRDQGYVVLGYDTQQNYADPGWTGQIKKGTLIDTLKSVQGNKFFFWYHFREPHLPYAPPAPYKGVFFKGTYSIAPEKLSRVMNEEKIPRGSVEFFKTDAPAIRDLYDAEVLYQDDQLAAVFDFLTASGLAEKTIIILTADHGEELLEHGFIGHASTSLQATLYDEVLHIPLLIRLPGVAFQRSIGSTVRQVDMMPTLFDLLRAEKPAGFQGRSAYSLLAGEDTREDAPVYAETSTCGWQCPEADKKNRLHAVRIENWKLIEKRIGDSKTYALFDLKRDPGETVDRFADHPSVAGELQTMLAARQKANQQAAFSRASAVVQAHLDEAVTLNHKKDIARARIAVKQILHLDYVYGLENPAFMEVLEFGEHWRSLMIRARQLAQELGEAGDGRSMEVLPP